MYENNYIYTLFFHAYFHTIILGCSFTMLLFLYRHAPCCIVWLETSEMVNFAVKETET